MENQLPHIFSVGIEKIDKFLGFNPTFTHFGVKTPILAFVI